MIDVVTVGAGGGSIAWLSPEGTLKVGPKSAGADPGPICYATAAPSPPSPTRTSSSAGSPRTCSAGRSRCRSTPRAPALERARREARTCRWSGLATGILEISAWNQANALRQVTVARGLDVRDFTLTTFGGSGSLLACRLMDVLGLPRTLVPPNPGNVSAFGLLTVDVRNDYVQTVVAGTPTSTWIASAPCTPTLEAQAADGAGRRGLRPRRSSGCSAPPTCATSARPSRCGCRWPTAPLDTRCRRRRAGLPRRAPPALRLRLRRRPAPGRGVGEPAGQRDRADPPSGHRRAGPKAGGLDRARHAAPGRCSSTTGWTPPPTRRPDLGRATSSPARRSSRSSARRSPCTRASSRPWTGYGNLLLTKESMTAGVTEGPRGRPGPGRDRRRHAGRDREGGRDVDRAHLALADDPRRPRLPRRHPRPAAAQAHRPLVLGAGAPGRPGLPDRDDERPATSSSTTTSTCPRAASGTCPTCA